MEKTVTLTKKEFVEKCSSAGANKCAELAAKTNDAEGVLLFSVLIASFIKVFEDEIFGKEEDK